jgi:hypothetical protein
VPALRRHALLAATLVLVWASTPAAADPAVPGAWHVTGDIAGRTFALDCRFEPAAAAFGGTCTETASSDSHGSPGKVHRLNSGSLAGAQIAWSYPVTVMFMHIAIGFNGRFDGNRITGATSAAGRKGSFVATRPGS